MRIYLASPYTAHPHGPDAAYKDAVRALVRVSQAYSVPIAGMHGGWQDHKLVWSPVVTGVNLLGKDADWRNAMRWCLSNLRGGKFSHLVVARVLGADRSKGIEAEIRAAEALKMQIIVEAA